MTGTTKTNIAEAVDKLFADLEFQGRSRSNDEEGAEKTHLKWWIPSNPNASPTRLGDSYYENGHWHYFFMHTNYGSVEAKVFRNWQRFPDLYGHIVDEHSVKFYSNY